MTIHYLKIFLILVSTLNVSVAAKKSPVLLDKEFSSQLSNKQILKLKKRVLTLSGKAVPTLIKVMKSDKYPDKNRWLATLSLAQIMGKKSSPFLSKFLEHPNWVMRIAALKSLLALKEKRYAKAYSKALKDKSFIVRRQALDTIKKLGLRSEAARVWTMLYDKGNYYNSSGPSKRTNIIREVIKTVGDLRFEKAKKPLFTMIQKKKYKDIFSEMDYSLSLLTGKQSPKGSESIKRRFWKKMSLKELTI